MLTANCRVDSNPQPLAKASVKLSKLSVQTNQHIFFCRVQCNISFKPVFLALELWVTILLPVVVAAVLKINEHQLLLV